MHFSVCSMFIRVFGGSSFSFSFYICKYISKKFEAVILSLWYLNIQLHVWYQRLFCWINFIFVFAYHSISFALSIFTFFFCFGFFVCIVFVLYLCPYYLLCVSNLKKNKIKISHWIVGVKAIRVLLIDRTEWLRWFR